MEPLNPMHKMLERAQGLCCRQEKCLSEIHSKLCQWGATPEMIEKIKLQLVADKFIDELRYAQSFAREKARLSKWGRKKIEMALRFKRIGDNHIREALAEIEPSLTTKTLSTLLAQKAKTIKHTDRDALKNKLIRFGLSRGFGYGEILDSLAALNFGNAPD